MTLKEKQLVMNRYCGSRDDCVGCPLEEEDVCFIKLDAVERNFERLFPHGFDTYCKHGECVKLKAENEALKADLKSLVSCGACKHHHCVGHGRYECDFGYECSNWEHWEWRGAQR